MGFKGTIVLIAVGSCIAVAIVLPLIFTLPQPYNKRIEAEVAQGRVVGIKEDNAGIFWGIPFSQPPIGDWRWRRPRDPIPYTEDYYDATYKRDACDQLCDQPAAEYSCPQSTSEDCLYLNVFVPERLLGVADGNNIVTDRHYKVVSGDEKLPVMIWFYGGNFRNGGGSCILYDGRFLADTGDVIVVTPNYRTAQMGFLTFGNEEEEGFGNFGLWDQVHAMQWVQENIHHFGGDPNKVTLFGQSAGAESIASHLTSDVTKDYFNQAILQSNPFGLPFRSLEDGRILGMEFARQANCTIDNQETNAILSCLRSRSRTELEAAYNETLLFRGPDEASILIIFQPWGPVVDQILVNDQPINSFMRGEQQKKPLIYGSTVDEGMIFIAEAFPNIMDDQFYTLLITAVFKGNARDVLERFPPQCSRNENGTCDNRYILNDLVTEFLFLCPQRASLRTTESDAWWYWFNQTWSFKELWEMPECEDLVCHAAELAYEFQVESLTVFEFEENERILSRHMMRLWSNFAKFGNPNGDVMPGQVYGDNDAYWPKFQEVTDSEQSEQYKALQISADKDFVMDTPFDERCSFWDSLEIYAELY